MAWNVSVTKSLAPDLEVLTDARNAEWASSIVLDASAFPLNAAGERELLAGQPLKKSGNQYVPWVAATDVATTLAGILTKSERVPDLLAHSDVPAAMWNQGQKFRPDRIIGYNAADATIVTKFKTGLPQCSFSFT